MSALHYFEEITKIPRPSGHEEKMREYLKAFAAAHHLTCIEDTAGNIILRRGSNPITLQGHMDMVPEADHPFDFLTQGITTYIKDGWIYADGTTLGADNGAGVALMLAALAAEELKDISLECLFTVDEEVGMTGVAALSADVLLGDVLINLDHEGILIGCAGGANTDALFPKIPVEPKGEWYTLKISGLLSGHSGLDIHAGRANAIKLAVEFLATLEGVQIASFSAGTKCNVIPKEAFVTFSTTADIAKRFTEYVEEISSAYQNTDPSIFMELKTAPVPKAAYDSGFLAALHACKNGVIDYSECGVLTSTNLAVVEDRENGFHVITLQRSAVNEKRETLSEEIANLFRQSGADVTIHSPYSGWLLDSGSPLLAQAKEVYRTVLGREPVVETTHAGVECGMIQEKYPKMHIISTGPVIEGCHTIHERMSLTSLEETERFLFALIRSLRK